ncbi:carbon-nitrogen hydrolase family protein [Legionella sp. km772]|uniref:carbon-nitrogen hydrolase family protein n=1 Tax=Legionella sp. km772 TaxID=2498111 RepID=UPI000F8CEB52|nr:carbon-nitrogen hydrolase family protein [Legionella sp. km772]RUR13886.1 carbon-nitrogen hydrolase family protein [Legionella sp. km772]
MQKVGLIQMTSSTKVEENLAFVEKMMMQAHQESLSLVSLPENFACMGINDDKFRVAETYGQGPIQEKMSQFAKRFNLWIIAGTVPIKTSGRKVRSTSIVFDNKGQHVTRYDKIHLFDVRVSDREAHKESNDIEPGKDVVVVDTPVGKIGLTVCYDLRFAELYQKLLFKGAEIFSVPSAFTAITGHAHWELLLRARAVENLSFVLAANQCGHHENGRDTYGHSMVVEPWGKIVAQKKTGIGLITADIDLQRLKQLREQFPCIEHHVLK